ncbi:MAG: YggS family pyridoxal phosphate-dependent enzyme [Candidatus Omnitrophica bacterium]|nr:YggS family pyridoxal phosphate-dependent enzyme [Candidatus Omnitrophota bacterium]
MAISDNVRKILEEINGRAELVAAAKTRTADEIREAVKAGVRIVGQNYVQEAEAVYQDIGREVRWHFIGHLQKNKVKKAVAIFDMIETVDSVELASVIDKRCAAIDRTIDVLIEVNSGREPQKAGVLPEDVRPLAEKLAGMRNIRLRGLMTMGPFTGDPEEARPYFSGTRKVFEEISGALPEGASMDYLSMGMSNSFRVAIEEGANLVRIGTAIFGERDYS